MGIRSVFQKETYIGKTLRDKLLNEGLGLSGSPARPLLTRREKEVLKHIGDELTTKEIADKLFLSVKTVETHRLNLIQKLEARNTAGLVKKAMEQGLL